MVTEDRHGPASGPHELPRRDRRALAGLVVIAILLGLAALAYVLVLEYQTRHALCTLIGPAMSDPRLPPDWLARYEAVAQTFSCGGIKP